MLDELLNAWPPADQTVALGVTGAATFLVLRLVVFYQRHFVGAYQLELRTERAARWSAEEENRYLWGLIQGAGLTVDEELLQDIRGRRTPR